MDEILTERLKLRPLKWGDTDDFYSYAKTNKVGPPAGWKPHTSKLETLSVLKSLKSCGGVRAIEYQGKMIGTVSVQEDEKRVGMRARMIGYSISDAYWGMGIATEAATAVIEHLFDTTNVDTIAGYCFPDNEASARVLAKCGMKREGLLKRSYLNYDSTVHDLICYLITREEYESANV